MVVVKLVVVVVGGVFLGREDVIFGQLLYIYIYREREEILSPSFGLNICFLL